MLFVELVLCIKPADEAGQADTLLAHGTACAHHCLLILGRGCLMSQAMLLEGKNLCSQGVNIGTSADKATESVLHIDWRMTCNPYMHPSEG